jgi:thiol-disulfide isomerase/thioredoxin
MRRYCLLLLAVPVLFLPATSADELDFDGCLKMPDGVERRRCLEKVLADRPIGPSEFGAIRQVVETDPAAGLEILDLLMGHSILSKSTPALEAELFDLEGQAHGTLGGHAESAAAFQQALELDDGTTRVRWVGAGESVERWRTSIDVGNGRVVRAARSFLAAGRTDEARRWLGLALSLGADVRPLSDWSGLGDAALSALAPERIPLVSLKWFDPLPDVAIPLMDGGAFPLAESRGEVLVLNFWATWCQPCIKELGLLQQVYVEERERGLEILAVNAQEPPQLVVPYTKELGLTMPIGNYGPAVHDAFQINTLPSMIVADRLGRVRGRWVGYEENQEREVINVVRALLENEPPTRELTEVLHGAELIGVEWARGILAQVAGVTLAGTGDGLRLLATHGKHLGVFHPNGVTDRRLAATRTAGRLRTGARGADDSYPLFGFHPGGTEVVTLSMPEGSFEIWQAPSPVFDVAPLNGMEGSDLLLGTRGGLFRTDERGAGVRRVASFGLVTELEVVPSGRVAVLESGGDLSWLDPGMNVLDRQSLGLDSWAIAFSGDPAAGMCVAPPAVVAMASGKFLAAGGPQLAVATRSGQLVILDVESGRSRFRADWKELHDLAAGDLDDDGLDELIVAAGSDVVVLSAKVGHAADAGD